MEKERLTIFSFSRSLEQVPDEKLPNTPFDLIARSIIVAWDAREIEVPLSFYRKGRIDIDEGRYIEAIYDFYFMLESVFAEKGNSKLCEEAFKQNDSLRKSVEKALIDDVLLGEIRREKRLQSAFDEHYKGATEEVIDDIVELRGFLHHYTSRRRDIWHPEEHERFEVDALVLQHIAYHLAFELVKPYVFSEQAIQIYTELIKKILGHKNYGMKDGS